jgi:hypothetical protein
MTDAPDDLLAPDENALTALDELQWYRSYVRNPQVGARSSVSTDVLRNALDAAFRAVAEKDSEIDRLTAQLDQMRDVPVEYVTERGLEAAMASDPDREDGALLRTTDGKRQAWAWNASAKTWEQVPPGTGSGQEPASRPQPQHG